MIENYTYGIIAADITDNCNLRCKFCCNDWSKVGSSVGMSEETFKKLIELMPLADDESFFLSCRFEPTIHPTWIELLEHIPKKMKRKTYLTTNLSKRIPLRQLERLSRVNLNILNISLETFNPQLYEEFRVGAKYDVFIGNLEDLVGIFKQNVNSPHIRFISMVFKQNLSEVESIVENCNEKYAATRNEFRTPFSYSLNYNDQEWLRKSLITRKEWDEMATRLSKLPYLVNLFNPPAESSNIPINSNQAEEPVSLNFSVYSDGTVFFHARDRSRFPLVFREPFNINDISDPYDYFKDNLYKILNKPRAEKLYGYQEDNK